MTQDLGLILVQCLCSWAILGTESQHRADTHVCKKALLLICSVTCLLLYWGVSSQALGRQCFTDWMRSKLDSLGINIIGIVKIINSPALTSNETDEAVNNGSVKSKDRQGEHSESIGVPVKEIATKIYSLIGKRNISCQSCSNQSLMFGINSSSLLALSSPKTTSLLPSVLLPLQSTAFSRNTKLSTITSLPSTTFTKNPTLPVTKTSQKREEMLLLCHHLSGRLGNQLFQSASVLGLSHTSNRTAIIFSSSFNGILKKPLLTPEEEQRHKNRCAEARVILEGSCCRFEKRIVRDIVQGQTDVRLGGYLQSWKYFDRFREQIKISLAFSEQIVRQATEIVKKIRAEHNFPLIGVHVRRGDYALDSSKKSGYVMATQEYFQKSMRFFQNLFPNAIFVVACETTGWCKSNLLQNASTMYLEKHSAAVDLLILSQLDHIIISTGTYSWWAGYLNPGMTVFFKDFIVPGTFIGKQFNEDGKDYLLPKWIPF